LLSNCGVGISHPPYSSDFAPADFSIFLKVKTAVKRKMISGHRGHQEESNRRIKRSSYRGFG
jgi:hypothetical protein